MTDGGPPPKPWERTGGSSGPAPFNPPSAGSTSDVIEASGTAKPGEIVSEADRNTAINTNAVGRPLPPRPWEQNNGTNTYGGYGTGVNYNSGYGSGTMGSYGGGYGGLNSGGMYGSSGYRGSYGGGGMYGSSSMYGGSGMYGGGGMYGGAGGMYGAGGMGGPMGGYGMGMGGPQDPNNPYGAPSAPPGFWMSFLRVMHGVVNFFGRISILVDQNTQAVHMFMSALLQLFDRSGMLYGELARFVLRMLGIRTKPQRLEHQGPEQGPHNPQTSQPKALANNSWDNVWGNEK